MLHQGKEVLRCEEEEEDGSAGDQAGLAGVEDGEEEEETRTPSADGSLGCPDGGGLMG